MKISGVCSVTFSNLGLAQEELEVASAEDAVVLHVTRQVDRTGAVDCAMHFHVRMNDVQVFLFILKHK